VRTDLNVQLLLISALSEVWRAHWRHVIDSELFLLSLTCMPQENAHKELSLKIVFVLTSPLSFLFRLSPVYIFYLLIFTFSFIVYYFFIAEHRFCSLSLQIRAANKNHLKGTQNGNGLA
jgi:hypothetical protein